VCADLDLDLDERAALTIRMLAADGVETAGSGHPGLPMGMATAAWVLWSRELRFDPSDPAWPDRDRFFLSAGHGSMLLYALLHLSGYGLPLAELRRFRQWGSATPGHPEFGHTPGVETTTGPLGQGIATATGLALAERMTAAGCNVAGEEPVVDHRTFVLCSDGDLMEGVSGEAASLAGHLGLGRLVVLYDDNGITIDGSTSLAFTEDVLGRFAAYGWHTTRVDDAEDVAALEVALKEAVAETERPSLIAVRSTIGYGAPTKAGTWACHGAPLGAEELAATKARFDWPPEPFHIPRDVAEAFACLAAAGRARRTAWEGRRAAWCRPSPGAGRGVGQAVVGRGARRGARRSSGLRGGHGAGHPGGVGQVPGRRGGAPSRARRRLGRSGRVDQRGAARRSRAARRLRWPGHPFRGPGTRHGGHRQRARPARRFPPGGLDLLGLLRLPATGLEALRPHGPAGRLRLHPRLRRPGRFPSLLEDLGVLPGIKVDTGAKPLAGWPEETVTEGLDGLRDRLEAYARLGARFAKWRAVIAIGDGLPSRACLSANAHALARSAPVDQYQGRTFAGLPEVGADPVGVEQRLAQDVNLHEPWIPRAWVDASRRHSTMHMSGGNSRSFDQRPGRTAPAPRGPTRRRR
jgi:transketolase N-terminal domain/subunit